MTRGDGIYNYDVALKYGIYYSLGLSYVIQKDLL